jgi:hypothetical protein
MQTNFLMSERQEDPKWDKACRLVDKRDNRRCQFDKCISLKEAHLLVNGSPKILDRAHILARSSYPNLKYNPNNIITLQRFIHNRMDHFQSPLTGEPVDLNLHYYWWYRIKTRSMEDYLDNKDYFGSLLSLIHC